MGKSETIFAKRILIALAAASALLLGWAGGAVAAPLRMPAVSVTPQSGPPGSAVTVSGHTFTPGAGSLLWDGAARAALVIDQEGEFSEMFTIPQDAAAGEHEIGACGGEPCAGDRAAEHASATFRVTARERTVFWPWLAAGVFLLALWFFWRGRK